MLQQTGEIKMTIVKKRRQGDYIDICQEGIGSN
jgi:hypothetical protein